MDGVNKCRCTHHYATECQCANEYRPAADPVREDTEPECPNQHAEQARAEYRAKAGSRNGKAFAQGGCDVAHGLCIEAVEYQAERAQRKNGEGKKSQRLGV